jgi:hypothetical protein
MKGRVGIRGTSSIIPGYGEVTLADVIDDREDARRFREAGYRFGFEIPEDELDNWVVVDELDY